MRFNDWLQKMGLGVRGLAKITCLHRKTITNLLRGGTPQARTLQKLVATTKQMRIPITKDMFK